MHRLLSWRCLLPYALVAVVLPCLVPPVRIGLLMFPFSAALVLAGLWSLRQPMATRWPLGWAIAAMALLSVTNLDSGLHAASPGVIGTTTAAISPVCFALAALALLAARRPHAARDGVLDGMAALMAVGALRWQWSGTQDSAGAAEAATVFLALSGSMLFAVALVVLWRLLSDREQSRVVVVGLVSAAALANVGAVFTDTWVRVEPTWAYCLVLMAKGLLIGVFLHPALPRVFEPEPNSETRLSLMRWLGPASALVVGPTIMVLLFLRAEAPSTPVAVSSVFLTMVVLLRIHRLLRQRETGRKELAERERRFRFLVENASDVIVVTDPEGRVTSTSGGVTELLGIDPERLIGQDVRSLLAEEHVERFQQALGAAEAAGRTAAVSGDVRVRRADGEVRWVSVRVTDHLQESAVEGWVLNLHDVTDRKLAEESLSQMALYDSLTGLPNRSRLREELAACIASGSGTAVLFCDLNGFKAVNDTLGHEIGDELLQHVAGLWSGALRGDDVLGRWGGDEFVVICPGVHDLSETTRVAERLLALLDKPILLSAGPVSVGCSIGAAVHEWGQSLDDLIRAADEAMYEVKRARPAPRRQPAMDQ